MIMLIIGLSFSAITAIILFDYFLVGFFPKVFKLWPSLDELDLKDILIEDRVYRFSIKTDIEGRFISYRIRDRADYRSLILTHKFLIVRNTYFTYLLAIEVPSIESYAVKKETVGKRIIIYAKIGGEKKYFQFWPKDINKWISAFSKISIPEG